MGLIPSSEPGWPVACAALKPLTGGMLHIHQNVSDMSDTKKDCDNKDNDMCTSVQQMGDQPQTKETTHEISGPDSQHDENIIASNGHHQDNNLIGTDISHDASKYNHS